MGNIGEQNLCTIRDKKFIKISWFLILPIVFFFSKLKKNILLRIHLLLKPDRKHSQAFENIPIICFRKVKSLKDILVRAKVL